MQYVLDTSRELKYVNKPNISSEDASNLFGREKKAITVWGEGRYLCGKEDMLGKTDSLSDIAGDRNEAHRPEERMETGNFRR